MLQAREAQIHFIAAGHYATETLGVRRVGEMLAAEFGVAARVRRRPEPDLKSPLDAPRRPLGAPGYDERAARRANPRSDAETTLYTIRSGRYVDNASITGIDPGGSARWQIT